MTSARDRVMQQVGARMGRTAQPRGRGDLPTQYGGQGEVLPLGAAGGIPVRGNIGSGGLAIGQPVSRAQGIVAGQPAAVQQTELLATAEELKALMAAIRRIVPQQVIDDVDPNGGTIYARQPFDSAWDKTRGVEYWYQPAVVGTDGEWVPKQQIRISASAPSGDGAHNGALWLQVPASGAPSLFVWRAATATWVQVGGGGQVDIIQNYSPTIEVGEYPGQRWINISAEREWWWSGVYWQTTPKIWGVDINQLPGSVNDLFPGDQYFVFGGSSTYKMFIWTGSAWWNIAYCPRNPTGSSCAEPLPDPPPPPGGGGS